MAACSELDSPQRDVAGRDVLQVLGGQKGRELGGYARPVRVREDRQDLGLVLPENW